MWRRAESRQRSVPSGWVSAAMPDPSLQSSEHLRRRDYGDDLAAMLSQIAVRRQALCPTAELRESWQMLLEGLCKHSPAPEQIWCLGIGPFSHRASVYQWALLQEFQHALEVGTD